jgi:hypothetical protein
VLKANAIVRAGGGTLNILNHENIDKLAQVRIVFL